MVWLLLGAIINPNNFLVYATSVATLITIVKSKIAEIESLYREALNKVKEIVDEFY
jgi:hypothetical protein